MLQWDTHLYGKPAKEPRGFAWLIALLSLIPVAAWGQPVPDRDTLLLAQFDRSVDADYAIGSATARLSSG